MTIHPNHQQRRYITAKQGTCPYNKTWMTQHASPTHARYIISIHAHSGWRKQWKSCVWERRPLWACQQHSSLTQCAWEISLPLGRIKPSAVTLCQIGPVSSFSFEIFSCIFFSKQRSHRMDTGVHVPKCTCRSTFSWIHMGTHPSVDMMQDISNNFLVKWKFHRSTRIKRYRVLP
jgi:hypothetical protein